ncbi:MAG TPA: hypothetical protein VJH23_01345 [archaeon]|nr:hypothetical protein [archaeon]
MQKVEPGIVAREIHENLLRNNPANAIEGKEPGNISLTIAVGKLDAEYGAAKALEKHRKKTELQK